MKRESPITKTFWKTNGLWQDLRNIYNLIRRITSFVILKIKYLLLYPRVSPIRWTGAGVALISLTVSPLRLEPTHRDVGNGGVQSGCDTTETVAGRRVNRTTLKHSLKFSKNLVPPSWWLVCLFSKVTYKTERKTSYYKTKSLIWNLYSNQ